MVILQLLVIFCFSYTAWAQEKGWQREWNDLDARARQERKVTVIAPPDPGDAGQPAGKV